MRPMERVGSSIQNMAIKQQMTSRTTCVKTKIQGRTSGKRHWLTEAEKRESVPKATRESAA
jgi:hypothetical protein